LSAAAPDVLIKKFSRIVSRKQEGNSDGTSHGIRGKIMSHETGTSKKAGSWGRSVHHIKNRYFPPIYLNKTVVIIDNHFVME